MQTLKTLFIYCKVTMWHLCQSSVCSKKRLKIASKILIHLKHAVYRMLQSWLTLPYTFSVGWSPVLVILSLLLTLIKSCPIIFIHCLFCLHCYHSCPWIILVSITLWKYMYSEFILSYLAFCIIFRLKKGYTVMYSDLELPWCILYSSF